MAHVPRLVKSCRVRCADRLNAVRNSLISRIFRQGPHSGPYKSGDQPPLWAHEPPPVFAITGRVRVCSYPQIGESPWGPLWGTFLESLAIIVALGTSVKVRGAD